MNLPEQPQAQWQLAPLYPPQAVVHRSDVVERFAGVVLRNAWGGVVLEQQQVRQRGLGALDLRREDSLLADICVEELIRVREQQGHPAQSPKRLVGTVEQALQTRCDVERWAGWKRMGDEYRVALRASVGRHEATRPPSRLSGCLAAHLLSHPSFSSAPSYQRIRS
jgi:hypothetical protein